MRKRLITPTQESIRSRGEGWLDVELAAVIEFTSEEKDAPVESAFVSGEGRGWLAATTGKQTIRLVFDQPQTIKCISLVFEESNTAEHRSSFCDGLKTAGTQCKKLCASDGISVHLGRYGK